MKVEIKKLKIHADDRGYLFEGLRSDDAIFDGKFGQSLVSVLYPGVVKAWHKHEKQTDYTLCALGDVKYCVAEELEGGKAKVETFFLGERSLNLIKVPPGLWHGYTALGNQRAILFHIMDVTFDSEDTQSKDYLTFGDVWTVKNG